MQPEYGAWRIVRELGRGSFGCVYEIEKTNELDHTSIEKAALKVIEIPQQHSDIDMLKNQGMSDGSIVNYFHDIAEDAVREIQLMSEMQGISNIVSYQDHTVKKHKDGFGWDIYIRMELLTPVLQYFQENNCFSDFAALQMKVAQLGIDLCRALERCKINNIIHRDIKPANIFVSRQGDFKLGDFGIARIQKYSGFDMSQRGTLTYMAPEIYNGRPADERIDLYSLGIVMYQLLNNNRIPFMPNDADTIRPQDKEQALKRRIIGREPLPLPANADLRLAQIILRACQYDPDDRYDSPTQMLKSLEAFLAEFDTTGPIRSSENIHLLSELNTLSKTERKTSLPLSPSYSPLPQHRIPWKKISVAIIAAVLVVGVSASAAWAHNTGLLTNVLEKFGKSDTEPAGSGISDDSDSGIIQTSAVTDTDEGYIKIVKSQASSELKETKHGLYAATDLYDNNLDTPWCEGVNGIGIGEWVTVDFDKEYTVTKLEFYNGFMKTEDLLSNNSQIRRATLTFSDNSSQTVTVPKNTSIDDPVVVTLDEPVKTSFIKITIESGYSGAKYSDTCLSELRIVGKGDGTVPVLPLLYHTSTVVPNSTSSSNFISKTTTKKSTTSAIPVGLELTNETDPNPDLYPVPTRDLSYDKDSLMRGEDIKYVQASLIELSYNGVSVNGTFDSGTWKAVKRFQKNHKLTVDGVVGSKTLNEMQDSVLLWREKDRQEAEQKLEAQKQAQEKQKEAEKTADAKKAAEQKIAAEEAAEQKAKEEAAEQKAKEEAAAKKAAEEAQQQDYGKDENVNADLYPVPERELSYIENAEMMGDDVKYVQAALIEMDYSGISLNGVFDYATQDAVTRFQSNHDLTVDGVVGPKTLAALQNNLALWRESH